MASTSDIKNGLCIEFNGELYTVVEFQHVKPGKGAAFVRTRIKNVKTGKVLQNTFPAGAKINIQRVERRKYQYLYKDDSGYHFMHNETYEQVFIEEEIINAPQFLIEGQEVEIVFHTETESPMYAELPPFVTLEITYVEPGVKGDTATNALKPATVNTGATVNVPLFVNIGEKIKVDTRTGIIQSALKNKKQRKSNMQLSKSIGLEELKQWISIEIIGDPEVVITGINEIHMVAKGDITFVDHPKYYDKVMTSKATVILINKKVDPPRGKTLLYTEDPFHAYVTLVKQFRPFVPSTAMVSDTAEIGEGTILQPGVFIGHHVKIGKNCMIHSNVTINDHCILGDEVVLNSNVVIGGDAFYFRRRPEGFDKMESCGRVVIGNRVEIGACTTIDRGVSGDTTIGDGSKLDNLIQVGHDTVIGRNCLIASQVGIAGVTIIQDNVTIWGQVGIQKGIVIESGAEILAKSGVPKSLKGNTAYFGIPVREARAKMREIALLKQLPGILAEITEKL